MDNMPAVLSGGSCQGTPGRRRRHGARYLQPPERAAGGQALDDLHKAQRLLLRRQAHAARQQRARGRRRAGVGGLRRGRRRQRVRRRRDLGEVPPQRRQQDLRLTPTAAVTAMT